MGKFSDLESTVYAVFGSNDWKSENIPTFPSNFFKKSQDDTFLFLSIIPQTTGININSLSGILIIDIFIPANNGTKESVRIADRLDHFLVGKVFNKNEYTLQFSSSALSNISLDIDNSSLARRQYTITFNFFGVT